MENHVRKSAKLANLARQFTIRSSDIETVTETTGAASVATSKKLEDGGTAYEAYETIESAIVSMDISALYEASRLMKEAERGARKKRETEWDAKEDHNI